MPFDPPLESLDLTELSGRAWTLLDGDGLHEADERLWLDALRAQYGHGPPFASAEDLRAHLDAAVEVAGERAWARVVAVLIAYLATHPQRRETDEALLADALREEFRDGPPAEVAAWLEARAVPAPQARGHGAAEPRRHFHSRPHS